MSDSVLVTGAAGVMGQLVCARLAFEGHQVIGIDRRAWPNAPSGVELHQLDIRKRAAEEVIRHHRPRAVIHMATVTHLTRRSEDRYRINLNGTRAVFDHCQHYGAEHAIFVGRHTYYGAAHDAPLYHCEDEPPIGTNTFPELADLIASDLYAGSALWRYPDLRTCVLRVCYTLGPHRHGTLASFLRGPRVPTILGFDPLFQFMHEADVARAVVSALTNNLRGVYNVAGPPPIPLSLLIRETGRKQMPVPELAFRLALGRFGLPRLPRGAISHIKYPIVMNTSAFSEATEFVHEFDEDATIRAFRDGKTS